MIFNNEKISARQLYRMLVLSTIGISCLLVTDIGVKYGQNAGIMCVIVAAVSAVLYGMLIVYLCEKTGWNYKEYAKVHFNKFISTFIYFIFGIKYFVLLVMAHLVLLRMVRRELLSEISYPALLLAVLVLMAYSLGRRIEARARLSECMIYVITIPVAILVILGISGAKTYYFAGAYGGNISDTINIIKGAFILFMSFAPVEMILFMSDKLSVNNVNDNIIPNPSTNHQASSHHDVNISTMNNDNEFHRRKMRNSILGGIATVCIINIIYYVIVVGNLSVNIVSARTDSVIRLTKNVKLPYLMFEKQGGIFMIFFVISIFFAIFCLAYHCKAMLENINEEMKKTAYKKKTNKNTVQNSSKSINQSMANTFLIVVLTLAFVTVGIVRLDYFRVIAKAGETRVQIEYRRYVDCMMIDYSEEENYYNVFLSYRSDEQENKYINYRPKKLEQLKEYSASASDELLDLSHVEVVVLSSNILNNRERYTDTILYIEKEDELSDSLNICATEQTAEEFADHTRYLYAQPGIYIGKMLENNISFASTKFLKLSLVNYGAEEECVLSVFEAEQDKIEYKGNVIVNQYGIISADMDYNPKINELVLGDAGYSITLDSGEDIFVDENHYDINVKLTDDVIHARLIYSGNIIYTGRMTEKAVNRKLYEMIYSRLDELVINNHYDILNIYHRLRESDQREFEKMHSKSDWFKNLVLDIDTNYNMLRSD